MPVDISVVIPTVVRPVLRRAIQSVRRQDFDGIVEVIVVADVPPRDFTDFLDLQPNENVIFTGGGKRGGGARELGVRQSHGEWIAFLDDDDEWTPSHLSGLMGRVREARWNGSHDTVILASRARQASGGADRHSSLVVPARPIAAGQRVEDYLFRKRRPSPARAALFAPTIMASRRIATLVSWNETLVRHQDWDWLLRAQRAGARIEHIAAASCIVHVGSAGSVSASTDWRSSLRWMTEVSGDWDPHTAADFIAGQPLRYALTARSGAGVLRCLEALGRTRRVPAAGPLLIGLSGLVGRRTLERALGRSRGGRRGAANA